MKDVLYVATIYGNIQALSSEEAEREVREACEGIANGGDVEVKITSIADIDPTGDLIPPDEVTHWDTLELERRLGK